MNQIGGAMTFETELDDMMNMAGFGIETDAAKIVEVLDITSPSQLDNIKDATVQQEIVDPTLSSVASTYINKSQAQLHQTYKFKVFSSETKDVELKYNHSNLQEILTHATTPYITVSTYYRVKALESAITRLGGLNVMTFVKVVARIVDNVKDGCGGVGNNCLFLEEGVAFFNKMTNLLIENDYHPIGSLTMANEMMKQSYYKQTLVVEPDIDSVVAAGKRRKSFKKKKGSKKKKVIANEHT